MSFNLYSVYDAIKHEFSLPFAAESEAEALRMFYVQMSSVNIMRICDKDYDLYQIGFYNTKTGDIKPDAILLVEGENFIDLYEKGIFDDDED